MTILTLCDACKQTIDPATEPFAEVTVQHFKPGERGEPERLHFHTADDHDCLGERLPASVLRAEAPGVEP